MNFQRITIETHHYELAAVALAAEVWLPQKAVNRTSVAVVAAMPTVATLYKRAARVRDRLNNRQLQGLSIPRGGKLRFSLTVPEAAAVMAYLGEGLLGENEGALLFLRNLRGSIHQQLSSYEGVAFEG